MTTHPPLDVLAPAPAALAEATVNAESVRDALSRAGVPVERVTGAVAPQLVVYSVTLSPGGDPKKVERAVGAVELALGSPVRYAGVSEGAVRLEVERAERSDVHLRALYDSWPAFHKAADGGGYRRQAMTFPAGELANGTGNHQFLSLAHAPHLLVAGTTGSGKSTFLTSLLVSLMLDQTPDDLRLVLVDPKRVEMAAFADSPHLLRDIVQDAGEAVTALCDVERMMDARYATFSEAGVKDVQGFNNRNPGRRMPRVVVVVDELADLMMTAGKTVEPTIVRLAQLGRAAGVHLVLATQRPAKAVFSPLIVDNIPARVVFAVTDHNASKVALGYTGAEKLAGRGDGLYRQPGVGAPVRFQAAYVPSEDVERLVKWWRRQVPDVVVEAPPAVEAPADDPTIRQMLDEWNVPAELRDDSSTPAEVLGDAGITDEVIDALASLLTERIAAGVLEHITRAMGEPQ